MRNRMKRILSLGLAATLSMTLCMGVKAVDTGMAENKTVTNESTTTTENTTTYASASSPMTTPGSGSTGNPSTGNPNTGNPSTGNPSTGNPSTGNPSTPNPGTGNPSTPNPGTGNTDADNSQEAATGGYIANPITAVVGETSYSVTQKEVDDKAFLETINDKTALKSRVEKLGMTYKDVTLLGSVDIKLPGVDLSKGVSLSIPLNGVKSGDTVYALHKKSTTNEYEWISCEVRGEGKVVLTLYSLSPVAFFKVDGAKSITPSNQEPDSPPTGEF
jgi:hypothetical protein